MGSGWVLRGDEAGDEVGSAINMQPHIPGGGEKWGIIRRSGFTVADSASDWEPNPEHQPIRIDREPRWFDLPALMEQTCLKQIEFRHETTSTNSDALMLGLTVERTPLLVLTESQLGGRGRGSNRWWASDGALTFSLLLEPAQFGISAERLPLMSLATAMSVGDLLSELAIGHAVGLKWPNDVQLNRRKICGILAETLKGRSDRLVIGVGLNVANSLKEAPPEIQSLATSLLDETGIQFPLTDVLIRFLQLLERRLKSLGAGEDDLFQRWPRHCVLTGRVVKLEAGEQLIQGICRGLGPHGGLLIERGAELKEWFGGVVRVVS